MTIFELLLIGGEVIKALDKANIKIDDIHYLKLYNDYLKLMKQHYQKTYIVAHLSEEYMVSEATIYRICKRFEKEVEI